MWGVGVDVKIDGIEAKDTESLLITGEKNGSSSMDVDQVKVNESSGSSAEDIQVQAAGVLTGLFQVCGRKYSTRYSLTRYRTSP
jgi:hypothetical protein